MAYNWSDPSAGQTNVPADMQARAQFQPINVSAIVQAVIRNRELQRQQQQQTVQNIQNAINSYNQNKNAGLEADYMNKWEQDTNTPEDLANLPPQARLDMAKWGAGQTAADQRTEDAEQKIRDTEERIRLQHANDDAKAEGLYWKNLLLKNTAGAQPAKIDAAQLAQDLKNNHVDQNLLSNSSLHRRGDFDNGSWVDNPEGGHIAITDPKDKTVFRSVMPTDVFNDLNQRLAKTPAGTTGGLNDPRPIHEDANGNKAYLNPDGTYDPIQ